MLPNLCKKLRSQICLCLITDNYTLSKVQNHPKLGISFAKAFVQECAGTIGYYALFDIKKELSTLIAYK